MVLPMNTKDVRMMDNASELELVADLLEMAYGALPTNCPPGPPTSLVIRIREIAARMRVCPRAHVRNIGEP
jgi:hypothetical protein